MTWTATATRGTAPYTYKFWIYHGGLATWHIVQAYTSTATLTWTPFEPGSYQVRVWARNSGSVTAYDAEAVSSTFTITAAPAVTVTALSANKTFPMDSAVTATWTATASGGVGPLQYKFTATNASNVTTTICDYGPSASCAWVPLRPSTYTVQVYVRSAGSTAAYQGTLSQAGLSVTGGGTTPISLTASVPFPAAVNAPVTWTVAIASGSNPLTYQFNWRPTSTQTWTTGQAYSASPTWTWTPNATGTYVVQAWAKESTFPGQFETYITTGTLTVTSGAVSSVSLTMSENFPVTTQTPITFTAGATGGTAALQYQFQLWDAQTSAWTVVQDYSAVRTWTWTPPRAGYGCYAVLVLVKSTGAPSWEASTQTGYLAVTP